MLHTSPRMEWGHSTVPCTPLGDGVWKGGRQVLQDEPSGGCHQSVLLLTHGAHHAARVCTLVPSGRWDPSVVKQRPPTALLALAKYRYEVKPMRPWHQGASTAQPARNGGIGSRP